MMISTPIKRQFARLTMGLSVALATTIIPAYAAPDTAPLYQPQLSGSVIKRIQTLMDKPSTWAQIPKTVTLCVYSPEGSKGKSFQQAMSYMTEIPKYTQMARDIGINLNVTMLDPLTMKLDIGYPKLKKQATTVAHLRVYSDERVLSEDFKLKKCWSRYE